MKPKQLIVLLTILIAMALLVIWKNARPSLVVKSEEQTNLNISFNPDQVTEIEIKKNSNSVVIKQENGVWQVPGRWSAKADPAKVKQLLEIVRGLKGEFRSDQADLFGDYEIDDASALHIALSDGGKSLSELLIGLKRPDRGGIFVRLHGSSAVYFSIDNLLANIGLFGNLKQEDLKPDFWLDLRLLELTLDQVKSISLTETNDGRDSVVFNLEKSPDLENPELKSWKLKDVETPFPIDEEKVKDYLRKFQLEHADNVLDPDANYGLDNPDFKLTVGDLSGAQKTLLFKKHDQKKIDYVVSLVGEKRVMLVGGATVNSLQVEGGSFKKEEPPKAA